MISPNSHLQYQSSNSDRATLVALPKEQGQAVIPSRRRIRPDASFLICGLVQPAFPKRRLQLPSRWCIILEVLAPSAQIPASLAKIAWPRKYRYPVPLPSPCPPTISHFFTLHLRPLPLTFSLHQPPASAHLHLRCRSRHSFGLVLSLSSLVSRDIRPFSRFRRSLMPIARESWCHALPPHHAAMLGRE